MKKLLFLISVMLVLVSAIVSADAAITYRFFDSNSNPVTNVDVLSYVSNDVAASSLTPFVSGNSGSSNQFTISYPTTPLSPYYYANYYFADGYLPWEARPTWQGTLTSTTDYTFTKKAQCRALVDNIESVNEVAQNVPLTINTRAYIDADTRSAFSRTPQALPVIPAGYEDYFSAETLVTLTITNAQGNVVYTDSMTLNILADQTVPVNFVWMPILDGLYYISIRSEVIDDQCSSTIPEFAEKDVSVLRTLPNNQYYTILNNLDLVGDSDIFTGQSNGGVITYTYDKISNFVDSLGALTPVATSIVTNLYDSNGALISSTSSTLAANPDNLNPVSFTGTATIPSSGQFSLEIIGSSVESLGDYGNIQDVIRIVFSLVPPNSQNSNNAPILYSIGDKYAVEGSLLSFTITAYDPDNDALTYSASNLPAGATFNSNTRMFRWTPSQADIGTYNNVVFRVSDGTLSDSETIDIFVSNEMHITSTPPTTAVVGQLYTYDVNSDDPNVRYYLNYYPNGMTIDPVTGLITWTPTEEGMVDVQIRISDGVTYDLQTYRITVIGDEDELGLPHKFTISSVIVDDLNLRAGDLLNTYIMLTNRGYQDEDDLELRVSIPELGIRTPLYNADLGSVENKWIITELSIPENTKDGEYVVKISVENDEFKDIYYTTIIVA